MEARRGAVQVDLHGPIVDRGGRCDQARDLGPVVQVRVALEHVEGEDDVLGRERHAIAPLDAVAQLDRELGVVGVVLVALGQPGDELVPEHVVVEQALGRGLGPAAARDGWRVGIEVAEIGEAAGVLAAQARHDQRAVAWHVGDIRRNRRHHWFAAAASAAPAELMASNEPPKPTAVVTRNVVD